MAVVEERSPEIVQEYRQKLEQKVRELLSDSQMDEGRIATEVTIFADKICVDEETVRLKSHIEAMKTALIAGGSIGRKLDFIAQEMNREANTTLSKANDLKLSDCAIDLKTGIEKVREQIQNLRVDYIDTGRSNEQKRNIDYCFRLLRSWKGNHYEGTDLHDMSSTHCPYRQRPVRRDLVRRMGWPISSRTKKEFEQMIADGALD